jgi:hypothetical protein
MFLNSKQGYSRRRWVPGGHVSAFLLHHGAFRAAIRDSLERLAQPPTAVAATG